MRITICSSMSFAKEIKEAQIQLEKLGFEVMIPKTTDEVIKYPERKLNADLKYCLKNDCQMDHFRKIENSDGIFVLNLTKNDIDGYIGGAVLTEMAIAKYLNKKIFVLNRLPNQNEIRWVLEIQLTEPIILEGEINKILNHV